MQLNKIFNAEDIEVLFAQWENVTGVKPLLLDSDGSVAIGEGEASEYRDVIKAGIEIVGYLSYAKKEDAEDENEAKAKIAALTIVLTQLAASEEKRMDEEKKNSDIHENVQKTSEYIQKINDITKQLDKIEKNQKILALNASIEAARAGEAGKGFAIVATNVSALATDFGNNNREIKDELQKLNEVIVAIEKCELYFLMKGRQGSVKRRNQCKLVPLFYASSIKELLIKSYRYFSCVSSAGML